MYDGTLATRGPWQALVTFQQFIVLSDKHGIVDMTAEAISRRTTIPLEILLAGIAALEQPDDQSRSPDLDGRRIVRLNGTREWGWQIVNYVHYRNMRSLEERAEYMRQYMRKYRVNKKVNKVSKVSLSSKQYAKAEKKPSHTASPVLARLPSGLWEEWRKHRGKKQTPQAETRQCTTLEKLALQGEDLAAVVNQSIERGWSGLFPVDKKTNGSGNGGWWTSDGKTIAHGASIGLHPRPGESMSAFRDRINEKEGRK
jgi:hypothetical protein